MSNDINIQFEQSEDFCLEVLNNSVLYLNLNDDVKKIVMPHEGFGVVLQDSSIPYNKEFDNFFVIDLGKPDFFMELGSEFTVYEISDMMLYLLMNETNSFSENVSVLFENIIRFFIIYRAYTKMSMHEVFYQIKNKPIFETMEEIDGKETKEMMRMLAMEDHPLVSTLKQNEMRVMHQCVEDVKRMLASYSYEEKFILEKVSHLLLDNFEAYHSLFEVNISNRHLSLLKLAKKEQSLLIRFDGHDYVQRKLVYFFLHYFRHFFVAHYGLIQGKTIHFVMDGAKGLPYSKIFQFVGCDQNLKVKMFTDINYAKRNNIFNYFDKFVFNHSSVFEYTPMPHMADIEYEKGKEPYVYIDNKTKEMKIVYCNKKGV